MGASQHLGSLIAAAFGAHLFARGSVHPPRPPIRMWGSDPLLSSCVHYVLLPFKTHHSQLRKGLMAGEPLRGPKYFSKQLCHCPLSRVWALAILGIALSCSGSISRLSQGPCRTPEGDFLVPRVTGSQVLHCSKMLS